MHTIIFIILIDIVEWQSVMKLTFVIDSEIYFQLLLILWWQP